MTEEEKKKLYQEFRDKIFRDVGILVVGLMIINAVIERIF